MRTTVTLDADTESAVRRLMSDRGISFKQALNSAIRAGLERHHDVTSWTTARRLGTPTSSLDRALQVAAELEDEERVRAMQSGR